VFVEKSALPIFPGEPPAAQICAATAPLFGPTVFSVKPWTVNRPDSSPGPAADFADFIDAADSNTTPTVAKPALFRQRVPSQLFLPGMDSPSSSPCSSKNMRYRFSPTNLQLHKSALPILPPVGMAAAAPMSGPTVFFFKPWTIQSVQTHRQPILSTLPISSALPIPTLPPVSKPTLFR
jgi:hypothetical protein